MGAWKVSKLFPVFLLALLFTPTHSLLSSGTTRYVNKTDTTCLGQSPCYTTIQAAITTAQAGDTVRIQAGLYEENLLISGKNSTNTATESDRITIESDPSAPLGSVILGSTDQGCTDGDAITIASSKFITLRGLTILDTGKQSIVLASGAKKNNAIRLERNRIVGNRGKQCLGGITIGSGNTNTLIVNNLIYGNGQYGLKFKTGKGSHTVVNNTIHGNGRTGISIGKKQEVLLVNNLITGNGADSRSPAKYRTGISRTAAKKKPLSEQAQLLNNLICGNTGGELSGTMLDGTDVGNLTPTGSEGPAPQVSASPGCNLTGNVYANVNGVDGQAGTVDDDFTLATNSPAIDRGADSRSLALDVPDTLLEADFSGEAKRPLDGDGNGSEAFDIGAVEFFVPNPPCPPPTITAITPTTGRVGTEITITGTHLDCGTIRSLSCNGVSAVITSLSATTIKTVIPIGADDCRLSLTTEGGSVTVSPELGLDVVLSRDFSLSMAPATGEVIQGSATTYRVSISGTNGFADLIALSVTGLPAGVTASFLPSMVTAGQSATLLVQATNTAAITSTSFTVAGTAKIDGREESHSTSANLAVLAGGRTALVGQFLLTDGPPLAGVKLTFMNLPGQPMTQTDSAGNFQFLDLPAGMHTLGVDATPADPRLPIYGMDVTLTAGQVTQLPAFHIMPPPAPEQFTPIQNATQDQAITNPRFPGASFILPAGVTITGWDNVLKSQMTFERLNLDHLPMPPPPVPTRSIYLPFFGTPMGGLPSAPIPVTLPNDAGFNPGEKAEIWYYDAAPFPSVPGQWRMAGLGTVSEDGAVVVSDPGVGIERFCGVCGAVCIGNKTNDQSDNDEKHATGGDPVNLFLGQMIAGKTDLVLPGRMPAVVHRTYNPFDPFGGTAGFELGTGPGWALSVDAVLLELSPTLRRLILPGNSRSDFVRQANGAFANAADQEFSGALLTAGTQGAHTLRLKDGTTWRFTAGWIPIGRPGTIPGLGLLVEQADRNGNHLTIERDVNGFITRLVEPAGRALVFTHTNGRLTEIRDPIGRTVRYSYNAARRLETATNSAGGVTRYTYDTAGRILTITDPRGITYLTNEYDASGRVVRQT